MAHDGIEVEIKIPVSRDNFITIKENLGKSSDLVKKSHQIDEYFTPPHRNFLEPEFPFEWLSIRKRGDKAILNYKHFYPENAEVKTHCEETEVGAENSEQLKATFLALNFQSLIIVDKERETYIYNDEFEIAFDIVKDLGYFIEIEALKNFGGIENTRKKLFEFAQELGLDISKTDKRGYPFLMLQKKGLAK